MKHNKLEPFNEPTNKKKKHLKKSIKLKEQFLKEVYKNDINSSIDFCNSSIYSNNK